MRPAAALGAALGLLAALVLATGAAAAPDKRPNILLILADDLGYSDIEPFGGEIPTPNLDALAHEGRLLTAMYSTPMPVSRAEVMTGADHHLVGVGSMYLPWGKQKDTPYYLRHLNDQALPVSEVLKDAGYHTYMVGTWHLGEADDQSPKARGFESSFALLGAAGTYYALPKGVPLPASAHEAPVYREDANLVDAPTTYATDLFTDKLLSYLKRDDADGRPFFAYAAYTTPHFPLQAPDEFIARQHGRYDDGYEALRLKRIAREKALGIIPEDFTPSVPQPESPGMPRWSSLTPDQQKHEARRMEVYAAMIENLDWNIGRIVRALKASGRYDNTFIVFTSGNGAAQGFTDLPKDAPVDIMGGRDSWIYDTERWAEASNAPFALWKAKPTEGGISVPTIVHLPGEMHARPAYREPTTLKDLTPTFLDLARAPEPGDRYHGRTVVPVSGRSLLPMLEGKAARVHPADAVFADENSGEAYVRQGRWKAVLKTDQHTDVFERGDPLNAEHIAVLHTGDMQKAAAIRAQWPARWSLYDIKADRGETHDLSHARPEVLKRMQTLYAAYRKANGVTDPL
jgi:arylsulfatase A-like enzyme